MNTLRLRPSCACLSSLLVCLAAAGCNVSGKSLNGQGVAMFNQGSADAAEATFLQARSADPANPHVYYNLGRVYHERGIARKDAKQLEQAENFYNLCLNQDPNHRECYRSLAVLLVEQDRSKDAFTLLENWAQRSPNIADARVEQARLHEEFKDNAAAKEKLLQALTIEPTHARALAALGRIRESEGEVWQAMHDYSRSLAHDRNQPDVIARLAALQSKGMPPGAGGALSSQPATGGPTPIFR
ncbi:MAG: tetratricopeptide repeat protein [Planctomycetia bacterium]|nr:tetratricopeptide repeat protein [Planctomycetia bacterium]